MSAKPNVLAQAAAARLSDPACGEQGDTWNLYEQLHAAAVTPVEARAAAAPLLEICRSCPIVDACRSWASLDNYTGIAAGSRWVDGSEKPVGWVRGHSPRRRLAS